MTTLPSHPGPHPPLRDTRSPSPTPYRSTFPLLADRAATPSTPTTPTTPLPPARYARTSMPRLPLHAGCVVCGIVASAASTLPASPGVPASSLPDSAAHAGPSSHTPTPRGSTLVGARQVVYHDADITAYPAEGRERLAERHIVVALSRHVQTVYELGPSDIPLLSHLLATAQRLLLSAATSDAERGVTERDIRVGFVGTLMRDPASPHAHLHAHAYVAPISSKYASFWRRNVVYTAANWWSIEDLRAEIRESTSNNRVKSGYPDRAGPIDRVPDAGAQVGLPNALDDDPYSDAPSPAPVRLELPPQGKGKARSEHGRTSVGSARSSGSMERSATGVKDESEAAGYVTGERDTQQ
ncbi:hypothetical protein Q5752_003519 [Cryptotrichosporon argae]